MNLEETVTSMTRDQFEAIYVFDCSGPNPTIRFSSLKSPVIRMTGFRKNPKENAGPNPMDSLRTIQDAITQYGNQIVSTTIDMNGVREQPRFDFMGKEYSLIMPETPGAIRIQARRTKEDQFHQRLVAVRTTSGTYVVVGLYVSESSRDYDAAKKMEEFSAMLDPNTSSVPQPDVPEEPVPEEEVGEEETA